MRNSGFGFWGSSQQWSVSGRLNIQSWRPGSWSDVFLPSHYRGYSSSRLEWDSPRYLLKMDKPTSRWLEPAQSMTAIDDQSVQVPSKKPSQARTTRQAQLTANTCELEPSQTDWPEFCFKTWLRWAGSNERWRLSCFSLRPAIISEPDYLRWLVSVENQLLCGVFLISLLHIKSLDAWQACSLDTSRLSNFLNTQPNVFPSFQLLSHSLYTASSTGPHNMHHGLSPQKQARAELC